MPAHYEEPKWWVDGWVKISIPCSTRISIGTHFTDEYFEIISDYDSVFDMSEAFDVKLLFFIFLFF